LRWFAGLDVAQLVVVLVGPLNRFSAEVFGPVVASNRFQLSSPLNSLCKAADYPERWRREINIDCQAFAVEVVGFIEGAKRPAIGKTVAHKVHGPDLVGCPWGLQRIRLLSFEPFPRLDADQPVGDLCVLI